MPEKIKTWLIHTGLFLITFCTCTFFSAHFLGLPVKDMNEFFFSGMKFSIPFLLILTVHEFGHYITARLYKIKASLPYFIPFIGLIGTLGAFIRIESRPQTKKQFFDVGIAGPLAGFVVAFGILVYAFLTLPPLDYLYTIHKDYAQYGENYADHVYQDLPNDSVTVLAVGDNLLFKIMEEVLVEDKSRIPHSYEMAHYPLLMAGFIALFFTALNLLPIGQLDGGHVLYGILGRKKHKIISSFFYTLLIAIGGLGLFNMSLWEGFVPLATFENFLVFAPLYLIFLYIVFFAKLTDNTLNNALVTVLVFVTQYAVAEWWPDWNGFPGYLVFAFIIGRFLGTGHPGAVSEKPLGTGRKLLGWFAILVFILSFSPQPFIFIMK